MNNSLVYSQKLEEIANKGPVFSNAENEPKKIERPVVLYFGPYGTVLAD